jgi:hypothetical protein
MREARAYNRSIYVMVSMPYLLLGVFGFLIYRGVKKNQAVKDAARRSAPGPEGLSCSDHSAADSSSPTA